VKFIYIHPVLYNSFIVHIMLISYVIKRISTYCIRCYIQLLVKVEVTLSNSLPVLLQISNHSVGGCSSIRLRRSWLRLNASQHQNTFESATCASRSASIVNRTWLTTLPASHNVTATTAFRVATRCKARLQRLASRYFRTRTVRP